MKVSVGMITYNHEDYITRAIESVLEQITSFSVELIIGEDNSTDATLLICKEYAELYPDKIKIISSDSNVGMMNNFIRTLKACDGRYVAFLEGDDYWTNPYKLQKQVDFLMVNHDYSACFHNVLVKSTRRVNISEWAFHKELRKHSFETEDLLSAWFIPTASVVFSNDLDFELPPWFPFCKSGDIPFLLLLSLRGKIKYLNEIMSVYRVHDHGISTTEAHNGYNKIIAMIFIYENFNIYTNFKYKDKVKEAMIHEINYHLPERSPSTIPDLKKRKGDFLDHRKIIQKIFSIKG